MMFKDILKELRVSKGILQEELGAVIGKSKSTIGMYETGHRMPNDVTLRKLSDLFGVSIDYLLGNHLESDNNDELLLLRKENAELKEKLLSMKNILYSE